MTGLIGIKCGTTRWVNQDGSIEQATLIYIDNNYITEVKKQDTYGYNAVQIASISAEKDLSKPKAGLYKKLKIDAQKKLKEFRLDESEVAKYNVGDVLNVDHFSNAATVSVTATSKGKGFAGTVKRHNFSMQRATHGNSLSHRAPGSIGQCQFPGRVNKGKKMAGQMGNVQRTLRNLKVLSIDKEKNVLIIKGSVPGMPGGVVLVNPYKLTTTEAA